MYGIFRYMYHIMFIWKFIANVGKYPSPMDLSWDMDPENAWKKKPIFPCHGTLGFHRQYFWNRNEESLSGILWNFCDGFLEEA